MGDDTPGPNRGWGRPSKYATAEEARAARNSARRNRCLEEAAMDEAVAVTRRNQHESLTEDDQQKIQLGFCLYIFRKF